jgi:hypothetical protein
MTVAKVYLKNKDLYEEIIKSKEQDALTPRAQEMLMLLAKRASSKLPYANPEDRKDCISAAYLDLWRYWRSFDPAKSKNAFAYYTEICKKGFAKGWNQLHPKKYAGTVSIDGGVDSEGIYTI